MELFGAMFGLSMGAVAVAAGIVSLLFPVFWLWMLVEAILRDEREYPGANSNEKLIWILVLVFVQISSVVYWFMVHTKIRRGSIVGTAGPAPTPPAAPTQA